MTQTQDYGSGRQGNKREGRGRGGRWHWHKTTGSQIPNAREYEHLRRENTHTTEAPGSHFRPISDPHGEVHVAHLARSVPKKK
jgi:hypothetical protein